jgi:hypothetical protein
LLAKVSALLAKVSEMLAKMSKLLASISPEPRYFRTAGEKVDKSGLAVASLV